jgi:light-regulated signal transduction histidine kinase (bacteriophytochrome)
MASHDLKSPLAIGKIQMDALEEQINASITEKQRDILVRAKKNLSNDCEPCLKNDSEDGDVRHGIGLHICSVIAKSHNASLKSSIDKQAFSVQIIFSRKHLT